MPAGVGHHEEALFREVRLPRPSHARGDAEAGTADVVRDIRIEFGGGAVMSLGEIGVSGLTMLMEVLTRRGMWGRLEPDIRLWVCQGAVSMRYGIRGLETQMCVVVEGTFPASGDVYVFSQGPQNHEGRIEVGW